MKRLIATLETTAALMGSYAGIAEAREIHSPLMTENQIVLANTATARDITPQEQQEMDQQDHIAKCEESAAQSIGTKSLTLLSFTKLRPTIDPEPFDRAEAGCDDVKMRSVTRFRAYMGGKALTKSAVLADRDVENGDKFSRLFKANRKMNCGRKVVGIYHTVVTAEGSNQVNSRKDKLSFRVNCS